MGMDGVAAERVESNVAKKADKLTPLMSAEKVPEMRGSAGTAVENLPAVDFIISKGQEETVYNKDGSSFLRKVEGKVDPNCKNGVKAPDGSEQRFDSTGLCKLIGDVKWGRPNADNSMDITVGNVKIQLDKNWKLLSVAGEKAQYSNKMEEDKTVLAKTQVAATSGWKAEVIPAQKLDPARARAMEKTNQELVRPHREQAKPATKRTQPATVLTGWEPLDIRPGH